MLDRAEARESPAQPAARQVEFRPRLPGTRAPEFMSPVIRKITYAITFEGLGILFGALVLRLMTQASAEQTLSLSVVAASIALVWSYIFNSGFEAWEARQNAPGRSFLRRVSHATLFEGGLTLILLPLTAWFLSVSLPMALAYELGLVLFYMAYAWVFTLAFDRLFGLPDSAR